MIMIVIMTLITNTSTILYTTLIMIPLITTTNTIGVMITK